MTDEEAIWLAGWLEGEGSFLVFRNRDKRGALRFYPRIQAVSVDWDIIEKVGRFVGGTPRIHKKASSKNQEIFLVKVTGGKAIDVMRRIRPLMGERRGAKIDELLEEFAEEVIA